jgi:type II secretory pathway pseudopilin PulG
MSFSVVRNGLKIFRSRESGMVLLEVLLAAAILGMVAVTSLNSLSVASKADFINNEQSDSECLASSQVEHIKNQSYIDFTDPYHGDYELVAAPANYTVAVTTVPVDPDTGQPLASGEDSGIQKITVLIRHYGEEITVLESYKVDR